MAEEDPLGMKWEAMLVGRPEGTHFAAGGSSPLALNDETNHLATQAQLRPLEPGDEAEELEDGTSEATKLLLAALAAAGAVAGAVWAYPRLKAWVSARRSSRGDLAPDYASKDNDSSAVEVLAGEFASQVTTALDEKLPMISQDEAKQRFAALLIAAAFVAEQMRVLAGSRIEGAMAADLNRAVDQLTAPSILASINHVLESNPVAFGPDVISSLGTIFSGGHVEDGVFVPLQPDRVREALGPLRIANGSD